MIHLGNVPAGTSIYIPFGTYGKTNGESITCSGLAVTDIEIYKNGSTTQRASDAGIALLDTDGIDFDSITGLHGFSIDLSDNTDASFYAVGSWYWVVVSAITVDSQTVTFLAATFRIAPAEALTGHPKTDVGGWLGTAPSSPTVAGVPNVNAKTWNDLATVELPLAPTTAGRKLDVSAGGEAGVDWANVGSPTTTVALTGTTVDLTTTALGAIWNRLTSSLTVAGSIGKRIVDYLTGDAYTLIGATGSGLTSLAPSATALSTTQWTNDLATALGVTNADLLNGGRLDLIFDLIVADTNELQTNQGNWVTATGFSTHSAADVLTALGTGSWATSLAQSSVWTSTLAASLAPIRSGTAQAGDATTITLDASASAVTDFYVPCGIYLTGGTGAGQFRTIDDYNGTTKVATVSESWYTTPDNTTTFAIRPQGIAHADMRALGGNELSAGYLKDIADYYGLNTNIPGHVESIATDVISADSVSAAAVTKIQNGLATAAELLLVKDRTSYCLTVLVGACADAGTAAETYVHAIGGETFTVDFAGLDATGTRTTTTLSKV